MTPSPEHAAPEPVEELRIYILVRNDITMPLGKAFAQVGHAVLGTVEAARRVDPRRVAAYLGEGDLALIEQGHAKIALRGKEKDLLRAAKELAEAGLPHALIRDAGRTVFAEPTLTCLGIGPVRKSELPKFVQRLQLYA